MQPRQVREAQKRGDSKALSAMGRLGGFKSGESKRYEEAKRVFLEDIADAKRVNDELSRMLQAGEITQAEHDELYRHIV